MCNSLGSLFNRYHILKTLPAVRLLGQDLSVGAAYRNSKQKTILDFTMSQQPGDFSLANLEGGHIGTRSHHPLI